MCDACNWLHQIRAIGLVATKIKSHREIIITVILDANSHQYCRHYGGHQHHHHGDRHEHHGGRQAGWSSTWAGWWSSTKVAVKQGGHQDEQDGRKMSLVTGPLHRPMASGGHWPHWHLATHSTMVKILLATYSTIHFALYILSSYKNY